MENSDLEVFYRDDSLQISPDINFETPLTPDTANMSSNDTIDTASNEVKCVMLYIEISHDIYQTFGDKTDAWVASVWSQVLLLFANEELTAKIKTLKIWDIQDPYPIVESDDFSGTETKLLAFGQRLAGQFDGDIAHLMGFNGNGGSAFVDVLCNKDSGYAYSGVYPTIDDIPVNSFIVLIVAHELGHQFGSPHTHSCVWGPNQDTAIDCCGAAIGKEECADGCNADPWLPPEGGTIMSY